MNWFLFLHLNFEICGKLGNEKENSDKLAEIDDEKEWNDNILECERLISKLQQMDEKFKENNEKICQSLKKFDDLIKEMNERDY